MTATNTSAAIHVTCSAYCGKPIYHAGMDDHDDDCGITAEELLKLNAQLATARIQATAAAASGPGDEEDDGAEGDGTTAPYRCVCGYPGDDWDDLAQHQTSTQHQGLWQGAARVIDADVDGAASRITLRPIEREEPRPTPEWNGPHITEDMAIAAQARIDAEELVIGGMASAKTCAAKATFDGVELSCPHRPIGKSVAVHVCNLDHKHSETLEKLCLLHAIAIWSGEQSLTDGGPLLNWNKDPVEA